MQAKKIDETWLKEECLGEEESKITTKMIRVDLFWRKIFKIQLLSGQPKYTVLPKVVKTLLSIHHGNADCERSLSDNIIKK